MYIENDGHSAIITIEPKDGLDIPNVIQGNLPGTYQLGQIRFRWGDDGKSGSEHYLFGVSSEVIIFFELGLGKQVYIFQSFSSFEKSQY